MEPLSTPSSRDARSPGRLAAGVAVVVLVLGGIVATSLRGRDSTRHELELSERSTAAALDLTRVVLRELSTAAAGAGQRLGRIELATGDGSPGFVIARDTGRTTIVLVADPTDGLVERLGVAVPIYSVEGRLTQMAPVDTGTRRATHEGFVVRPLDDVIEPVLDRVAEDVRGAELVHSERLVAAAGSDGGGLETRTEVPVTERAVLELVLHDDDPLGAGVVVTILVAAALAAGAFVVVRRREIDRLGAIADAEAARRDLRVVTDVAPVAQKSLDVGEVLPAVAVAMVDGLGLDGLSITTADDDRETVLFATGETGGGHDTVSIALGRGGRRFGTLRASVSQPLDERGRVVLGLLADLLSATLANASLFAQQQAAVRRLRELDELKTVFLATASHELRTPITAINGFASLLRDSWDRFTEEERRDFAHRVAANAGTLESMVSQLLDFSRLEGGELQSSTPVDVDEVVTAAVGVLRSQNEDHEIRLWHSDEDAWIAGSRGGIERIVGNLVSNAAKYSPAGTTIDVRVTSSDDEVGIVVDDEGPGVPAEEREQIFGRFFRGAGEGVLRTRGAGVGLSIVTDFAAAMGGRAAVADAPGGGARFVVTFPRLPADAPREELDVNA